LELAVSAADDIKRLAGQYGESMRTVGFTDRWPNADARRLASTARNALHTAIDTLQSERDALLEALRELVELKNMKERLHALHEMGHGTDYDSYHKRKPLAWEAARSAIKKCEEAK
jgi:hypothetical protein